MPSKNSRKNRHRSLNPVPVGDSLLPVGELQDELDYMKDVLLGREEPPVDLGQISDMEIASAFFGRAMEIQSLLHRAEMDGDVARNSRAYKFRTGELRDFIDLAKNRYDMFKSRMISEAIEQKVSAW